jgi:hypothetical protein
MCIVKTYRIVGGVLAGICLFSVACNAIGHWLGDEQLFQLHAQALGPRRIQRVLGVDERSRNERRKL